MLNLFYLWSFPTFNMLSGKYLQLNHRSHFPVAQRGNLLTDPNLLSSVPEADTYSSTTGHIFQKTR